MNGDAIKQARISAGFSQAQAARLLHVAKRSLEDWEAGRRKPKKGEMYLAECILACGILTEEGRKQVETGAWSMEDALAQSKIRQARVLSKCGAFGDTFDRIWNRIPEGVIMKCYAGELAVLVDEIKDAYDAGVRRGC